MNLLSFLGIEKPRNEKNISQERALHDKDLVVDTSLERDHMLYQFRTRTMEDTEADERTKYIQRILDTYKIKDKIKILGCNWSCKYIMGYLRIDELEKAKEIVKTIESCVVIENSSLIYQGERVEIDDKKIEAHKRGEEEKLRIQEKEKRDALPKFIYQFQTKETSEVEIRSQSLTIDSVLLVYKGNIHSRCIEPFYIEEPKINTDSHRHHRKNPDERIHTRRGHFEVKPDKPKGYISGVITLYDETSARELAGTIKLMLEMQKSSLTYKGKSLEDNIAQVTK